MSRFLESIGEIAVERPVRVLFRFSISLFISSHPWRSHGEKGQTATNRALADPHNRHGREASNIADAGPPPPAYP
jgi:hypothetical protein